MAKVNRKRFRLGCVIDRLHVGSVISSKKHNRLNREQDGLEKFINPELLHSKKNIDLITIKPDVSNKAKNQTFTRSKHAEIQVQSKYTEGGSVVCELCGNQSFKAFPKTLEVEDENGKTSMKIKKVCRKCYAPKDSSSKSKNDDLRKKIQPYYEPPLTGVINDRASKSWHFIRRDYICRKKMKLHHNRCKENEFSENFLSHASSDESNLSDYEEDSDESDIYEDIVDPSVEETSLKLDRLTNINSKYYSNFKNMVEKVMPALPEIYRPGHSYINDLRNHKGYQDHLALRNEWSLDSDCSISPKGNDTPKGDDNTDISDDSGSPNMSITRPVDLEKVGNLLEDQNASCQGVNLELVVNQNESDCSTVSLPINVESSPSDHSDYCQISMDVPNDDAVKSSSNSLRTFVRKSVHDTAGTSEDEYVEVECVDDDNLECKLLDDIDLAMDILLVDSEPTHLTPPNSIETDLFDCFENKPIRIRLLKNVYDKTSIKPKVTKGNKPELSYDKGVCRLVTIINKKKGGFKDNSSNSTFYDTHGISHRKQDLPSFVELDDEKALRKKTSVLKKKEIDDLLSKYSPSSPPQSPTRKRNTAVMDGNLTLKELQDKFWPNRLSQGASKDNVCDICSRSMLSCSTYDRNNVPPRLLPHFKDTENKIRACKACVLTTGQSSGTGVSGVTIVAGTKRPLLPKKDVSVPTKKFAGGNVRILPKIRRFSRFLDTPMFTSRSVAPKFIRSRNNSCSSLQHNQGKMIRDSIPTGSFTLNDDFGKILIKSKSPQSPLSSFGRLNLKVVQNPNENEIKNIAQNCKTKYVIVQTAPNSGESKVQKLATDKNSGEIYSGETKLGNHGDITINGQKYKIDTEFKLNDLVKDNENALLSAEAQKDLLNRLPSILKRTASKGGLPTHFKIVNVVESTPTLISSSVSSPNSLTSPRPQTIIVQSIAPGQSNPSIQTIAPGPPKIISNLKGTTFQSADYTVNPVKKFQNIAPAPPKVSSRVSSSLTPSFVVDGSIIGTKTVSYIDTSVYPRVTTTTMTTTTTANGSIVGTKRHTVLLPPSKFDQVVMEGKKTAKIIPSQKPDPVIIDIKPKTPVKNLVEIRLPANTSQRTAREVVLNSPVDSLKYVPPVLPGVTEVISISSLSYSEASADSKLTITPNSNSKSSAVTSLYSDKSVIYTNLVASSSISSGLKTSLVPTTIVSACLNRSANQNIDLNKDTISPSLVKSINASVTTKMSATSSSLVKSINELRASLHTLGNASTTTAVNTVSVMNTITSNNTLSSLTKTVKSTNAVVLACTVSCATSSPVSKSICETKLALKTIKRSTKPFVISIGDWTSSITSKTYATASPSLVKSLSSIKVPITSNSSSRMASSKCMYLNPSTVTNSSGMSVYVTSTTSTNSLLSSIRQIQQQIKTTCIVPSKSHVVKISSQPAILPSTTSPIKVQNQNGNKAVTGSSNQVLELSNGIKIVGTCLNSEIIRPRMENTSKKSPLVNTNNQTTLEIISENK